MEIVIHFLAVIGGLVASLVIVICGALAIGSFRNWLGMRHEPSYREGFDTARAWLHNDSRWFSESPETAELIQDLASGMRTEAAREKWREARKQEAIK